MNLGVETNDTDRNNSDSTSLEDNLSCHVTVCDINQAMLDVGKQRAAHLGFAKGKGYMIGIISNILFMFVLDSIIILKSKMTNI